MYWHLEPFIMLIAIVCCLWPYPTFIYDKKDKPLDMPITTSWTNPLIPDGEPGSVSERINLSDCEGARNVGGSIPSGDSNLAWETVTLLTIMQNSEIYVRNDILK